MLEDHFRLKIWNEHQHPLVHTLSSFAYTADALGGGTLTLNDTLDWILSVLYPVAQASVSTPSDLPEGGTVTITVADPAVVTLSNHSYSDGDLVYLTTTDTLPTGLSPSTNYYVVNSTTNTLQLSTSADGDGIETTGAGAGTHTLHNVNLSYRVVQDDGDGSASAYRWEQREGEANASWHKIYDMDWGVDSVLTQLLARTQEMYAFKWGADDLDAAGDALTGVSAGQHLYGGASANTHLTLHANSGDGVGSQTGYVQFADNTRPQVDSTWSLGTTTERWLKIWTDEITSGTLTATSGSVTDSSGAISFGNENLSTTGTVTGATGYYSAAVEVGPLAGNALVLAAGSITDESGAISFGNENLSTTGTVTGATGYYSAAVEVGPLAGNALVLAAGSITDESGAISFGDENLTTTGTFSAEQVNVNNIRLDGNTLSSTDTDGNVIIDPNGSGLVEIGAGMFPTSDSAVDLGKSGSVWNKLWVDGSIGYGANEVAIDTLISLSNILSGVSGGESLFYNSGTGKWDASIPDTEIDHGTVSGLSDDDHTQYALLAGRAGGQTITGGTASGDDLTLESTSDGTKGNIFFSSNPAPTTDASYSGGWSGTDMGDSSHYFRDVYSKGVFIGLRLENAAVASLPAASAQNTARLWFATDTKKVFVDTGGAWQTVNVTKWESDEYFNGSDTSKNVTVSGSIADARKALWQVRDNANDYEVLGLKLTTPDAATVTIHCEIPLPAGSYRLIGLEL